MAEASRPFRSDASYNAEVISRAAVAPFLESRGLVVANDERRTFGKSQSQLVSATLPDGRHIRARVRLCWRWEGRNPKVRRYSAFQLASKTVDGDWNLTLQRLAERDTRESITHTLAFQRDGHAVAHAVLIPSDEIPAIWQRQKEASDELIAKGLLGRTRKNHAANGDSPTIWLQDARNSQAHQVADVVWDWPGVIDLLRLPEVSIGPDGIPDDTWDDLGTTDPLELGRDHAERRISIRSTVRRDRKVREAVLSRANGRCERRSCGEARSFRGFLDVHHILGVEKSDRVFNCVALCPNCHREAHFSLQADEINNELLISAQQFYMVE